MSRTLTPAHAKDEDQSDVVELRVTGLSVRYGGVQAVRDMELSVVKGEVHGLIGPNGAGKTSFIDAITGFERPVAGRVTLKGLDVTRWSAGRLVRLGMARTFQNLELFRDLTVVENLRASGGSASDLLLRERAELLSITAFLPRLVSTLPFGAQRLVSIARALMAEPTVLVLDEPAAGLHQDEVTGLAAVLRRLVAEERVSVLLADHDMGFVLELCDTVTVMSFGERIAYGPPEQIRDDPTVRKAYLGDV
jgi:ABC-type branched-subunit amino acid transport system ATPase component